jgi:hypothetical protein
MGAEKPLSKQYLSWLQSAAVFAGVAATIIRATLRTLLRRSFGFRWSSSRRG